VILATFDYARNCSKARILCGFRFFRTDGAPVPKALAGPGGVPGEALPLPNVQLLRGLFFVLVGLSQSIEYVFEFFLYLNCRTGTRESDLGVRAG
jgi:hypothetical protein